MKTTTAFILATANLVAGHATFQSFVIGGKDQGQHFAVQTPSNANNPILDVTSPSMVCNGGKATSDQVSVAAGSSVTMQWHHNDPASSGDADEPIAASHKGPVMVYIAPAASNGQGAVWTKIYEDGYSNGKWGVDNFISAAGKITVNLPNLMAGDYLIRPELIALHEAETPDKAQFYNGCGQIKVTGSGSVSLPTSGTDMTKAYSATDPGVLVNIYSGLTSYTIPGPPVWDGVSTGGSSSPAKPSQPATPASSAAPVKTSSPSMPSKPSQTPAPAHSQAPAPAHSQAPAPAYSQAPAPAYSEAPAPAHSQAPAPAHSQAPAPVYSQAPAPACSDAPAPAYSQALPPAPSGTPPKSTQPTPSHTSSSGFTLPETFTIEQFITWLKNETGDSARRVRRHAREF